MSSGKAFTKLELLDFINSIVELKPYKALIADHEGHIEGRSMALGPHKIAMLLEIFKQWKEHSALMSEKDKEIARLETQLAKEIKIRKAFFRLYRAVDSLEIIDHDPEDTIATVGYMALINVYEKKKDLRDIANGINKEALAGGKDES